MIPKRIICTHKSQGDLDRKLKYCLQQMRDFHPEWEFLFFSDGDCGDFIRREAPDFEELYAWYPRVILKADLFRLLAVHRLGGFYLDTDFFLNHPLDELCAHAAVFPWEAYLQEDDFNLRFPHWVKTREKRRITANYAFGAEAGHPFLSASLRELVARTETFDAEYCHDLDVLHSTGPDALTSVYYRDLEKWQDVVMLGAAGMGLGKYGVHLVHGSWGQRN